VFDIASRHVTHALTDSKMKTAIDLSDARWRNLELALQYMEVQEHTFA
jgi:hypothetical protein